MNDNGLYVCFAMVLDVSTFVKRYCNYDFIRRINPIKYPGYIQELHDTVLIFFVNSFLPLFYIENNHEIGLPGTSDLLSA